MSVNYDNTTKGARLTAVRDQIDAGAGPGVLELGTAGMALVIATIPLNDPSGTVAGTTLTFSGFPKTDVSADNSGQLAAAQIKDSNGNVRVSGLTVGTSGTDIIVDNTNVQAGQQVTVNSLTIQHA